jgi:hypothetical protein
MKTYSFKLILTQAAIESGRGRVAPLIVSSVNSDFGN